MLDCARLCSTVLDCARTRRQNGPVGRGPLAEWVRAVGARCPLGPRSGQVRIHLPRKSAWSSAAAVGTQQDGRSHPSRTVLASTKQARRATTSVCWTTKHCLVRAAMRVIATLLPAVRKRSCGRGLAKPQTHSSEQPAARTASSQLTSAEPQRSPTSLLSQAWNYKNPIRVALLDHAPTPDWPVSAGAPPLRQPMQPIHASEIPAARCPEPANGGVAVVNLHIPPTLRFSVWE